MKFTQFLFPNRRRQETEIDVPEDIEKLADELVDSGWSFEIECFPDSQIVHADCCDQEQQLANTVVPNGPKVPEAITTLVREAHKRWDTQGRPKAVP